MKRQNSTWNFRPLIHHLHGIGRLTCVVDEIQNRSREHTCCNLSYYGRVFYDFRVVRRIPPLAQSRFNYLSRYQHVMFCITFLLNSSSLHHLPIARHHLNYISITASTRSIGEKNSDAVFQAQQSYVVVVSTRARSITCMLAVRSVIYKIILSRMAFKSSCHLFRIYCPAPEISHMESHPAKFFFIDVLLWSGLTGFVPIEVGTCQENRTRAAHHASIRHEYRKGASLPASRTGLP